MRLTKGLNVEASRLLRVEKLSVSEASYKMGFKNLGHFTKVFEKNIGKKPMKYLQSFKTTDLLTNLRQLKDI